MKRALLIASTVAALAFAGAASAQSVTGTVNVTGSVAAKCFVVGGGDPSSFSGTIALGELASDGTNGPEGTLRTNLPTAAETVGYEATAQVNCTSSNVAVSLLATKLDAGLGVPAGSYTSTVNYTAGLNLLLDSTGTGAFTYNTLTASGATTGTTGAPLQNAANNVTVSVWNFGSQGGPLLRAATTYASTVTVNISPAT
ncbi:MAG TPA: hypothetical protein VG407_18835 [Caulobacteraceae bacterium]|jgi:hypothetical protein|nr:hypothetical protein [Caulobacteraceae bacterium]